MITGRIQAVKGRLVFGDVAGALGLKGASRAGWDCPACASVRTLRERSDHQGARCSACGKGYDILGVVMTGRGDGALAALVFLETLAAEKDARAQTGPGLFGD